jgi:hypothetical protein
MAEKVGTHIVELGSRDTGPRGRFHLPERQRDKRADTFEAGEI